MRVFDDDNLITVYNDPTAVVAVVLLSLMGIFILGCTLVFIRFQYNRLHSFTLLFQKPFVVSLIVCGFCITVGCFFMVPVYFCPDSYETLATFGMIQLLANFGSHDAHLFKLYLRSRSINILSPFAKKIQKSLLIYIGITQLSTILALFVSLVTKTGTMQAVCYIASQPYVISGIFYGIGVLSIETFSCYHFYRFVRDNHLLTRKVRNVTELIASYGLKINIIVMFVFIFYGVLAFRSIVPALHIFIVLFYFFTIIVSITWMYLKYRIDCLSGDDDNDNDIANGKMPGLANSIHLGKEESLNSDSAINRTRSVA